MQEGFLSTTDLTSRLNISQMTIWRDLKRMEADNLLRRVRGGVEYVPLEPEKTFASNVPPFTQSFSFPLEFIKNILPL